MARSCGRDVGAGWRWDSSSQEDFGDPAKCFPPLEGILCNLEPRSSTELFLWSSALGGEPYDPEGLGNRVEWNHLSQPNKTVPGGNATETCKTVTKVG